MAREWLHSIDISQNEKKQLPGIVSVAVIIPYYNGARFIERALRSVRRQTVQPREIFIVNDGSTPAEAKFLDDLCRSSCEDFTVIHKENGGQGSARNAGANASNCTYLCFLDQDDFYLPNHIEDLLLAIPKDDGRFGFLYADLSLADIDGNFITSTILDGRGKHPKSSVMEMISGDMFVLPSASLILRDAFMAVGGFDVQFKGYEDDDLFLRLFRAGYTGHFLNRAVTAWCIHTESTSFSIHMVRSRFLYFKKLYTLFPDNKRQNRFFFRDCLVPRFERPFIVESIKAKYENSIYEREIFGMLEEFLGIVMENRWISMRHKYKLRLIVIAVRWFPRKALKTSIKIAWLMGYAKAFREWGRDG